MPGAQIVSSIDLQSGYLQLRIADEDVQETAFTTHHIRGSMNLVFYPLALQRKIDKLFDYLPCVIVFSDDLFIFNKTEEEHKQHMEQMSPRP